MKWCDALSTELVSRVCFEAVFLWDRRTIREAGEQRERASKFPQGFPINTWVSFLLSYNIAGRKT